MNEDLNKKSSVLSNYPNIESIVLLIMQEIKGKKVKINIPNTPAALYLLHKPIRMEVLSVRALKKNERAYIIIIFNYFFCLLLFLFH